MTIEKALALHEDSLVLLSFVLKKDMAWILVNQSHKITKHQETRYNKLISKRLNHWPVAYLTGHKEFYGLDFKTTPDTLIPRPDSEVLVELALSELRSPNSGLRNVVDLGTGSGCLIISIAKNLPKKKIKYIATDISVKALKVARRNAKAHKVDKKINFLKGDLLEPIHNSRFMLHNSTVVANLPYLKNKQLNNLTIKHEPKTALVAGVDGLKYYQKLFKQLSKLYIQKSIFYLEFDPRQKKSLAYLVKKYFPKAKKKFHKDLSGKWRVLEILF